ncbi:GntR family transcriptional regulator [Pseudonocardia zijingensis]|uniref:GntR family transcriptional regulator n=1 Tax=Pseudonocardia zijingensis TaxID=153376 RepID=A0ABN1N9D3_9PSEU
MNSKSHSRTGYTPPGAASEAAHPTASAFATTRLREAILNGELQPGDRLNQHQLAARLGLSHVPLREALQRLEFEGFIAINPRRGAFVVPLTASDAAEIFELRANLEAVALRASVPRLSPEQIMVAKEICREGDRINDTVAYGDLNWRFHRALNAACDRPRTLTIIETLWRNASRYSMLLRHRDPYFRESQREHWTILNAAANKNGDAASDLLRAHIGAAAARIQTLLES